MEAPNRKQKNRFGQVAIMAGRSCGTHGENRGQIMKPCDKCKTEEKYLVYKDWNDGFFKLFCVLIAVQICKTKSS